MNFFGEKKEKNIGVGEMSPSKLLQVPHTNK